MEYLRNLDAETFTAFLIVWGAIGVLAPIGMSLSQQLPISSRVRATRLEALGTIDKKLGWIIMETPILIVVAYFYLAGPEPLNVSAIFIALFMLHYTHRALIFPHRIKVAGKRMPVIVVLATMSFYIVNGYLVGHYFGALRSYELSWLMDPRFIVGMTLFIGGCIVNVRSDTALINLRAPGETGYKIPRGGLFEYVSCPNFFGEIIEWAGFALMTWSSAGSVYAIWVCLTLFSTALGTHRWYREQFGEDYPKARKAVFPFVI
jgi:3-oxo-5-alpha-steroid 4-dehydrogenase 1